MTKVVKTENKEMVVFGVITATSKKQGDFVSENPRKSLYLKLDDENTEKAKEFGLTEYGKEEKYFIVKASETITQYKGNKKNDEISGLADDDTPNFKTPDGKTVGIALFKGNNKGNDFIRVYALMGDIETIEEQNPFADFVNNAKSDAPKLDLTDKDITF